MLTERKILDSVTYNLQFNSFDVKWINEILRDGEAISRIPHRCSYNVDDKASFINDLGAEADRYIVMAGW